MATYKTIHISIYPQAKGYIQNCFDKYQYTTYRTVNKFLSLFSLYKKPLTFSVIQKIPLHFFQYTKIPSLKIGLFHADLASVLTSTSEVNILKSHKSLIFQDRKLKFCMVVDLDVL